MPAEDIESLWFVRSCSRLSIASRLLVWTLSLALATVWQTTCGYSDISLTQSLKSECWVLRSQPGCVRPPASPVCIHPTTIENISPRFWVKMFVEAGPVWVWVPVFVWLFMNRQRGSAGIVRFALQLCAFWFVAWVQPMRFTGKLTSLLNVYTQGTSFSSWDFHFDPSGHVFVFGLQLCVLWVFRAAFSLQSNTTISSPMRAFLLLCDILELMLWYFSCATASFHHNALEIVVSYLLCLTALAVIIKCTDKLRVSTAEQHSVALGEAQRVVGLTSNIALFLWFAFSVLVFTMLPKSRTQLILAAIYDIAIYAFAWYLQSSTFRTQEYTAIETSNDSVPVPEPKAEEKETASRRNSSTRSSGSRRSTPTAQRRNVQATEAANLQEVN